MSDSGLNHLATIEVTFNLIETIDETFEMLGCKAKPKVYGYLKNQFGISKDEIPSNPETFSSGLSYLFGSAGMLLEFYILKRFYNRLGMKFDPKDGLRFSDYVKSLYSKP